MKALIPLVALVLIGTAQAQAPQSQPPKPVLRSSDVRVQSVPARPAAAPRSTRTRAGAEAGELSASQPTFRSSETQSTPPSTTAGLVEALGLGSR